MRQMLLVRHAHAEKQAPHRSDIERRLDERGLKDAAHLAEAVHKANLSVDRLMSSPAMRTQSTARALLHGLGLSHLKLVFEERIYDADRATLVEVLRHVPDESQTIILVGHNPGISRLARWACDDDDLAEFEPAEALLLRSTLDHWVNAMKGSFDVVKSFKPR